MDLCHTSDLTYQTHVRVHACVFLCIEPVFVERMFGGVPPFQGPLDSWAASPRHPIHHQNVYQKPIYSSTPSDTGPPHTFSGSPLGLRQPPVFPPVTPLRVRPARPARTLSGPIRYWAPKSRRRLGEGVVRGGILGPEGPIPPVPPDPSRNAGTRLRQPLSNTRTSTWTGSALMTFRCWRQSQPHSPHSGRFVGTSTASPMTALKPQSES